MLEEALLSGLNRCGLDVRIQLEAWNEVVELLAALDAIARSGSNALVKIDGGRPGPEVYTVVVSGGRLGETFFRKDGADLRSLLRDGVSFFIGNAGGDSSHP
jgi:hypothetical protein